MTPDPTPPEDADQEGSHDPGSAVHDGMAEDPDREPTPPQTGRPDALVVPEDIDWRGWVLVAAVLLAVLVVPAIVLFIPELSSLLGSLGFTRRQAYLVFPMVPAILLGVIAVWAAVSAGKPDS